MQLFTNHKTTSNIIGTLLLVIMLALPASAAQQSTTLVRYAGNNQIETAIKISAGNYGPKSAQFVILARSNYFADAIAATTLATKHNAPILLTETATLSLSVVEEIKRVIADGGIVLLIGGEQAISSQVEQTLQKSLNNNVQRIAGANRWETSQKIYSSMGDVTNIAFVSAHNDAMGTALLAAVNVARGGKGGIIYTDGTGNVPGVSPDDLASVQAETMFTYDPAVSVSGAILIGGTTLTEQSVNTAELAYTQSSISLAGFAAAAPNNLADALSAAPVLANAGAPIFMLDIANNTAVANYLTRTEAKITHGAIFGGRSAVPDAAINSAFTGHTKTEQDV